jgi:hypothetical protein
LSDDPPEDPEPSTTPFGASPAFEAIAPSVVPSTLPSRLSDLPSAPPPISKRRTESLLMHSRWLFLAIPAIGILELLAHAHQVMSVTPAKDWIQARAMVKAEIKDDDLLIFEPGWVDPIGREMFGDDLVTLEREARPDDTRFARAFEVSIRGKHAAELQGWSEIASKKAGSITIRTLVNPSPAKVIVDLVSKLGPQVSATRNDLPCTWSHGSAQTGNLGFGPAVPADRFQCSGGFIGVSVVPVLDYSSHRCILASPPGGSGVVRLKFPDVAFGHALHGHHGLYVEAERKRTGAPITITFKTDDRVLGTFTHIDGDSWKPFEIDTSDLAGTTHDLTVEIAAHDANDRRYCFEADTR